MEGYLKKIILGMSAGAGILALVHEFRRRDESERTFRGLLSDLTLGATPEAVLQRLAERAGSLVHATGVYVERIDKERQELFPVALHGQSLPPSGQLGRIKALLPNRPSISVGRSTLRM